MLQYQDNQTWHYFISNFEEKSALMEGLGKMWSAFIIHE